jgi:para-nitrobenzyl esterase
MPRVTPTVPEYRQWLATLFGAATPAVEAQYPVPGPADVARRALEVYTDVLFTCPTRIAARSTATVARQPVYLYYFTRVLPGAGGEQLGAYHSMEIIYAFGNRVSWLPWEPVDDRLSDVMAGYWTRFVATGDPNGGGAPVWPRYDGSAPYLELGAEVKAGQGLKQAMCDAIEPGMRRAWDRTGTR